MTLGRALRKTSRYLAASMLHFGMLIAGPALALILALQGFTLWLLWRAIEHKAFG